MKKRPGKQVKEGESPPPFHSGETPPGALWCLVQGRHESVGAGPETIPKNDQRVEHPSYG